MIKPPPAGTNSTGWNRYWPPDIPCSTWLTFLETVDRVQHRTAATELQ